MFDTLAAAKALREAGFEDRQAEGVAGVVRSGRDGLATKADIAMLRAELDTGLAAVRAELDTGLAAVRADLYRALWIQTGTIAGIIVAASGFVVAAVKLL